MGEVMANMLAYPVVFTRNENGIGYSAFLPDLGLFAAGERLEDAYNEASTLVNQYFVVAKQLDYDYPTPSTLDEITARWGGHKISLLSARV